MNELFLSAFAAVLVLVVGVSVYAIKAALDDVEEIEEKDTGRTNQ